LEKFFQAYDELRRDWQKYDCIDCSTCNNICCNSEGYVILFPYEEEYLKIKTGRTLKKTSHRRIGGQRIKVFEDCGFLQPDGRCENYSYRMVECRFYPFQFTSKGEVFYDPYCKATETVLKDLKRIQNLRRKWITLSRVLSPQFLKVWDLSLKDLSGIKKISQVKI
jgi:Fe-S-cluster containining protein